MHTEGFQMRTVLHLLTNADHLLTSRSADKIYVDQALTHHYFNAANADLYTEELNREINYRIIARGQHWQQIAKSLWHIGFSMLTSRSAEVSRVSR
jgi:hypothetical protein